MAIIDADFVAAYGTIVDLKHRRLIDGITRGWKVMKKIDIEVQAPKT